MSRKSSKSSFKSNGLFSPGGGGLGSRWRWPLVKWLKVTMSTPEEDMISDQCGLPGVPHGARLRSGSGGGLHPCGLPHQSKATANRTNHRGVI